MNLNTLYSNTPYVHWTCDSYSWDNIILIIMSLRPETAERWCGVLQSESSVLDYTYHKPQVYVLFISAGIFIIQWHSFIILFIEINDGIFLCICYNHEW